MVGYYVFIGVIALALDIIVCHVAAGIAVDKGYTYGKWFCVCFFLPFGFLLVSALPYRRLLEAQEENNELLRMLLKKKDYVDISQNTSEQKKTGRHTFNDLPNI